MKIEKINENQIRCTLTKEDLADRNIKISELAYGTEKAKNLFKDMMIQANDEFGFEAEAVPLMIEAVPISRESIVLIITKVSDPEELDTRFSRFSPSDIDEDEDSEECDSSAGNGSDTYNKLMDAINSLKEEDHTKSPNFGEAAPTAKKDSADVKHVCLYGFRSIAALMDAAKVCGRIFEGESTLYKHNQTGAYFLKVSEGEDKNSFKAACLMLTEYSESTPINGARLLSEHLTLLIEDHAIEKLSGTLF